MCTRPEGWFAYQSRHDRIRLLANHSERFMLFI